MLVVWVVVVASCYSPSIRDCMLTCAAGNTCPTGFECHDNFCRMPGAQDSCVSDAGLPDTNVDADPNGDPDTDGVINADDNCPLVSNADQANEDLDDFGDVCDPCPPYGAANANIDSDGDGVGDGCDPSPDRPGERLRLFVGFTTRPLEPQNIGPASAWVFDQGRAIVTTDADELIALLWDLPLDPTRRELVSSNMEITGFRPSNMPRGAGVVAAYTLGDDSSATCALGLEPDGAFELMLLRTSSASDNIVAMIADPAGGGGVKSGILVDHVTGNEFRCATPNNVVVGKLTTGVGTRVGLRARGLTATFDWFMVVDSTN